MGEWPRERPAGRLALVLETEDFQFLIDSRDLWKPPRVVIRRGCLEAEVWLDDQDVSFTRPPKFAPREAEGVLALVSENLDELLAWWCTLKDDVRRGRLERNVLVD